MIFLIFVGVIAIISFGKDIGASLALGCLVSFLPFLCFQGIIGWRLLGESSKRVLQKFYVAGAVKFIVLVMASIGVYLWVGVEPRYFCLGFILMEAIRLVSLFFQLSGVRTR